MYRGGLQMRIDVEEIWRMTDRRKEINAIDLSKLEIYLNGEKSIIPESIINAWDFSGLTNIDFINHYFAKKEGV
jgi:hypothetical protein